MLQMAREQAKQWLENLARAMSTWRLVIVSGNDLFAGAMVWTYPGEVLRAASLEDLRMLLTAAEPGSPVAMCASGGGGGGDGIDPSSLMPLPQQVLPVGSDRSGSVAIERDHLVFLICDDLPDGEVEDALAVLEQAIPAPRRRVLAVLEDSCDRQRLQAHQQAGTEGLCTLGSLGQGRVYTALAAIASGGTYIDPLLRQRLLASAGDGRVHSPEDLTPLERRLLRDVCRGYNSHEIAGRQGLTDQSVRRYLSHVYRRLRVRDRAQAIGWCFAYGLIHAADLRGIFPSEPCAAPAGSSGGKRLSAAAHHGGVHGQAGLRVEGPLEAAPDRD